MPTPAYHLAPLVLSLFPGIGLLDIAFEEAGFCVVRGPDLLWGGDVHRFHPPAGRFDGIIGGPPCQAFSTWRHLQLAQGRPVTAANLIPEYERCVAEAAPGWFLMENVRDAPTPDVPGYAVASFLLNNRWVGGEQNRVRRFSFGVSGPAPVNLQAWLELEPLEPAVFARCVHAIGNPYLRTLADGRRKLSNTGATKQTVREALRLQGLPDGLLDHCPLTVEGQQRVIGNGVPLPMGRALARAIRAALED